MKRVIAFMTVLVIVAGISCASYADADRYQTANGINVYSKSILQSIKSIYNAYGELTDELLYKAYAYLELYWASTDVELIENDFNWNIMKDEDSNAWNGGLLLLNGISTQWMKYVKGEITKTEATEFVISMIL